ncbi:tryptophan 2,3-dioxygenase [Rickettsiales bacterium Ac37b]|nr:tryptophan 2,3-dioxygenase [Rickettsiales bacterium Ac37b]
MFQIVHQVEELWMKLINYTLFDINEYIKLNNTNRITTLFKRVHKTQQLMIEQLSVLETMSPKEYQKIRIGLGKGSGMESPGFRTIFKIANLLWESFLLHYLNNDLNNIEKIYDSEYSHNDSYLVAELLVEFDELFQIFLYKHMKLVERSIGIKSRSLKGVSIEILNKGIQRQFFPHLWQIRSDMANAATQQ